ncbi:MAG: CopD family protein [Salinivirgaceae bacterium]
MIAIANLIMYWLHLVATVVWIGGIGFILLILIPKTKEVLGQDAGKLIGEVSKQFKLFADWSIILLIITGIVLSLISKVETPDGAKVGHNTLLMIIKHVFVIMMILIHLYRNFRLSKKIEIAQNSTYKTKLQKLSLNLVRVVFVFGLIVLLLSVGATG